MGNVFNIVNFFGKTPVSQGTTATKISVPVPTQAGTLIYNGSSQSASWNNYDTDKMTLLGVYAAYSAGSRNVEFKLNDPELYEWSDGVTAERRQVTWVIERATVALPSQSGTLTYSGSAQSPSWSGYDTAKMTISGTTSATNAGSYTVTFTPTSNYQWSDSTTAAKSVTWTIGKATGSLTLSTYSHSFSSASSYTVTATRSGSGAISASSSNSSVATVSVSGTSITITAKATGSATITVSCGADTNYTAPASRTVSVSVSLISSTLKNNSWAQIQSVAKTGAGSSYWSVGDRVSVAISGTVGSLAFSGTYDCFIIAFNHSDSGTEYGITFQFGKNVNTGKDIVFVDKYFDKDCYNAAFVMYRSATNQGGWASSYMRNTICSAFLSALPSALRSVIAYTTIYTDNVGGKSSSESSISSTSDKIFLLSEYEVTGKYSLANYYEQWYQSQYTYYASGNSKVKYYYANSTYTEGTWWTRSPYYGDSYSFVYINNLGSVNSTDAGYSLGFAPVFRVA
jgi:hypothetical protein